MRKHGLFAWQTDGSVSGRHGVPYMQKAITYNFHTWQTDVIASGITAYNYKNVKIFTKKTVYRIAVGFVCGKAIL